MLLFAQRVKTTAEAGTLQRHCSPNRGRSVSARHGTRERGSKNQKGRKNRTKQKKNLQQNRRKPGWQKQQLSLNCVLASGETTTLSLTVTLLINTPASAGGIIAPASPVILYLTCCYCQTPSPLRETERRQERETWGEEEEGLLCICVCMCVRVWWSWRLGRCCLSTVRYKVREVNRRVQREKEKQKTHAGKSNECMLLTEIPGARLRDSDGGKSCSFSLSD